MNKRLFAEETRAGVTVSNCSRPGVGMFTIACAMRHAPRTILHGLQDARSYFHEPAEFPWLATFTEHAVSSELRALANAATGAEGTPAARALLTEWQPDWQNLTGPGTGTAEWSAITLLNKGTPDPVGCRLAPVTCAQLVKLVASGVLTAAEGATEVGARLLRLGPGASLRPHHGPGGKLHKSPKLFPRMQRKPSRL